jgi:predicted TIM-barrel fold metal-dependent hydrolase
MRWPTVTCGVFARCSTWHGDPKYNYVALDYLTEPRWLEHFRLLREFGLSFDLQLYPSQVDAESALIEANAQTPFRVSQRQTKS